MMDEYTTALETLGLSRGASKDDIKKAYFRLIRTCPPEKEPEKFQLIRSAYELLKDRQPPPETVEFDPPTDFIARSLISQANDAARFGEYDTASGILSEALSSSPDSPYLLLELARMQRAASRPRKAAKTAQELIKLAPECLEAYLIAAWGNFAGGWHKKAMPLFEKAYDLGERRLSFLDAYADCASQNRNAKKAAAIRYEILENRDWKDDTLEYAVASFSFLASQARSSGADADALLDRYGDFLRRLRRSLWDTMILLTPVGELWHDDPPLPPSSCRKTIALLELFLQRVTADEGEVEREILERLCLHMTVNAFDQEPLMEGTSWSKLATALQDPDLDEAIRSYAVLDIKLCLLRETDKLAEQIQLIQTEYPLFASRYGEVLAQLSTVDEEVLLKWKRRFASLSDRFEGSQYYERYPEERAGGRTEKILYQADTPFVRSGKKTGRNDPCPCGSGKKFKRCCIGKGIYD